MKTLFIRSHRSVVDCCQLLDSYSIASDGTAIGIAPTGHIWIVKHDPAAKSLEATYR